MKRIALAVGLFLGMCGTFRLMFFIIDHWPLVFFGAMGLFVLIFVGYMCYEFAGDILRKDNA